ncbi:MAG: capsid protein, partial [Alphaproteobacteria bacterium]|nr:capsid protein [Alphaproteobacteria bacterium]
MSENVPFHIDPVMTAAVVAYRNPAHSYIANNLLPIVNVGMKKFSYRTYPIGTFFDAPDATMGRTGESNQVNIESSAETAEVLDYGLHDLVPADDVSQAQNA